MGWKDGKQHPRVNSVCWWLWLCHRNRKDKGQDLWESKRYNEKQKPVSERRKDWIYHRKKRIKRRGKRMEKCDKTGIKAGDWEDIRRRNELATIALAKNDAIWKKNWKTKLTTRMRLYETLVKSVLSYNCGTRDVSKDDQRKLSNFCRRQLRKVIGIQWPHKISNNKLYKITGTKPLSITIMERR